MSPTGRSAVSPAPLLRGFLRGASSAWPVLALAVAVGLSVLGPVITPFDPNHSDLARAFTAPQGGHVLGFDSQGRDLLSRLLTGARSSLLGPFAIVVLSMTLGAAIAVIAAWIGGRVDSVVSSVLEIMFSFPGILLAMLSAAVFGAGLWTAVVALSVAYVPYAARLLRSAALAERRKPYIQALEVQGVSAVAICVRHLIPNLAPLLAAQGALFFGYAMVDLAILSYFGLGVQVPDSDWGVMVATGQAGVLQGYPMESLSAGLCIVMVVISVNVLGERLAAGPVRPAGGYLGRFVPRRQEGAR